ncbi:MAG: AI-2E family transporter [Fuerstiella sp.]
MKRLEAKTVENAAAAAESIPEARRLERWRTAALVLIAFILVSHALYVTAAVMMPVTSAMVIALALRPAVRKMNQFGIPPMVSAGIAVAAVMGVTLFLLSRLVTPASEWLGRTPVSFKLRQLQQKLEPLQEPLQNVSEASRQISEIASTSGQKTDSEQDVQQVVVRPPSLIAAVVSSTSQLAAGALLCVVLTFFFLARGDVLISRLSAALHGRRPDHENGVILEAVEHSVSTYLMTVSVINACLGAAIGLACWLIGVPNPMLWGVMAAALNFLPYVGGLIGAAVLLMVSLFSFDSVGYASVAPCVYLTLTTLEGNLITPSVLGKSMSLNPLIVILSLTYWTWIWGPAGAILAVPLLAVFAAACRQLKQTQPLAAILSE